MNAVPTPIRFWCSGDLLSRRSSHCILFMNNAIVPSF